MAKLHIRGKGTATCSDALQQHILAPGDAAAIYEAYISANGCTRCDFKDAVQKMRSENAYAVMHELDRIGLMREVRISFPIGSTTLILEPTDPDSRMIQLEIDQVEWFQNALFDVSRILKARDAIEKRSSQPECAEEGCHATPIGWLQRGFSERTKVDTHEERALTPAELRRCDGHQGRAA